MCLLVLICFLFALFQSSKNIPIDQAVSAIAFSPSGDRLAALGTRSLRVFDVESEEKVAETLFHEQTSSSFQDEFVRFYDEDIVFFLSYDLYKAGNLVWFSIEARERIRTDWPAGYGDFATAEQGFIFSNTTDQTKSFYSFDPNIKEPLFTRKYDPEFDNHFLHSPQFGILHFNGTFEDFADTRRN